MTPFFASDPMLSSGWGQVTYPAAIYVSETNQTHVCWEFVGFAGYKGARVASYDHTSGTWGERYTAGNYFLPNDEHGAAVLIRDADGYIHCFFGSHANPQKWSVTNNPDDVSSWTQMPDVGATATYPGPVMVGSTLYLFVRNDTPLSQRRVVYATLNPVAGAGTFSSFKTVVDLGNDSRAYRSEVHAVGTDIHFVCTRANAADTIRQHVYYFVLDTTTGNMRNAAGTTTVLAANLPVTLAQANASFRIVDQGSNNGDLASFQFDTAGNAHLIFADGLSPTYTLKHMMFSGGVWSAPVAVATIGDNAIGGGFAANYTIVPGADGAMEAWFNVGGDKVRRVRAADGTWADAETIKTADAYRLLQGSAVQYAHPEFRALFAENSGTVTDTAAAFLAMYAYGDTAPVSGSIDMTPIDPLWNDVVLLLGANHRNNATSIIDESKSSVRATFIGNARIDTSHGVRMGGAGAVTVPSAFTTSGTSDFSFELSVWLNETGRLQCLVSKRPTSSAAEFALYLSAANQLQFLLWQSSAAMLQLFGSSTLAIGPRYDIEVRRIGGTTYIFRDGELEVSGVQSAAPAASSAPLSFGRDVTNTARDFNGWWTEARFTRAGRQGYTPPPFPRR